MRSYGWIVLANGEQIFDVTDCPKDEFWDYSWITHPFIYRRYTHLISWTTKETV